LKFEPLEHNPPLMNCGGSLSLFISSTYSNLMN
jgi:hypothetical protein